MLAVVLISQENYVDGRVQLCSHWFSEAFATLEGLFSILNQSMIPQLKTETV